MLIAIVPTWTLEMATGVQVDHDSPKLEGLRLVPSHLLPSPTPERRYHDRPHSLRRTRPQGAAAFEVPVLSTLWVTQNPLLLMTSASAGDPCSYAFSVDL